jgi:hypothetical protein
MARIPFRFPPLARRAISAFIWPIDCRSVSRLYGPVGNRAIPGGASQFFRTADDPSSAALDLKPSLENLTDSIQAQCAADEGSSAVRRKRPPSGSDDQGDRQSREEPPAKSLRDPGDHVLLSESEMPNQNSETSETVCPL